MCYAALVQQNAQKLSKEFGANIYWPSVKNSLKQRYHSFSLPSLSAFDHFLLNSSNNEILEEIKITLANEQHLLEKELENLRNEIYDLNYELAVKERKGLRNKLEAKQRKLQRLEAKKNPSQIQSSFGFTYPHQNLFAVYEKDGNFQVSSFEYGHFRETGNPLDDILFHTNHSPSRKAYGLYNTRIESLSPEYQSKVQMQLFKSKNQRLRQAKQNLSDYQNARGFFTSSKIKVVQSFLKKYSLEENYLNKIDPSEFSYLQKLFPKNRAVIVAKAFEESVLIDDYYKNKKMNSGNKHMPIEFFLKDQLLYFPAIYSESLAPESPLSGLSIITMPPRPEVLEAGHDRSPICLNKNAALEYLNSELNLKDYPNFFKENLIANKLENKPKAIDAI